MDCNPDLDSAFKLNPDPVPKKLVNKIILPVIFSNTTRNQSQKYVLALVKYRYFQSGNFISSYLPPIKKKICTKGQGFPPNFSAPLVRIHKLFESGFTALMYFILNYK
jgi:hypothetical protein